MTRTTKDQDFRLNQQDPDNRDEVNIRTERKRRHRKQLGEIVQHADRTWWLRYFVDNPAGSRVKIAERLNVPNNAERYTVEAERNRRMAEINAGAPSQTVRADDASIGSFFEYTYKPWLVEEKPFSTAMSQERRFNQYMGTIARKSLRQFTTIDATEFLDGLAKLPLRRADGKPLLDAKGKQVRGLNANTHRQCRSLLSAIFRRAINTRGTGWENRQNPIREAEQFVNPRAVVEVTPYTAEEIVAIIAAIKRGDARLMFALVACMGIRPSEVAALKWSDFRDGRVFLSRSAAYGHLREGMKTKNSKGDVIVIEPE